MILDGASTSSVPLIFHLFVDDKYLISASGQSGQGVWVFDGFNGLLVDYALAVVYFGFGIFVGANDKMVQRFL